MTVLTVALFGLAIKKKESFIFKKPYVYGRVSLTDGIPIGKLYPKIIKKLHATRLCMVVFSLEAHVKGDASWKRKKR